ncbi:MAG: ATP-binding protein [Limnospira sp.]
MIVSIILCSFFPVFISAVSAQDSPTYEVIPESNLPSKEGSVPQFDRRSQPPARSGSGGWIWAVILLLAGGGGGGYLFRINRELTFKNRQLESRLNQQQKELAEANFKLRTNLGKLKKCYRRMNWEIVERQRAEAALKAVNQERELLEELSQIAKVRQMDDRVKIEAQKTALEKTNERLQREIQDRRKAEEAAEAANRAKSIFLANMNHELRTPLNAILGFAQLMSRDPAISRQNQEYLNIICQSGEHLLTLINDVLEVSKIEAGVISLNPVPFDLYFLLNSLEQLFQLKAKSGGLVLRVLRDSDLPRYLKADERKLRQILINLLGNAIKFTETGSVTLRVAAGNSRSRGDAGTWDTLYCEVEDTGPGIAPEDFDRLFEPFGQTETGRRSGQGSGLGLSIGRRYVELMGGKMGVRSQLGQGTTFEFHVRVAPVSDEEIPAISPIPRPVALAPGQPAYRILVVEDEWENRLLLQKLLAAIGFEVRTAENGRDGVLEWQRWRPHLILMDVRMPVADGYEATRQIRDGEKAWGKRRRTPILAFTSNALEEERTAILAAGCDDFISKPFREDILLEKMRECLGSDDIYERVCPGAIQSQFTQQEPTRTDLQVMPKDWVAQLHQAAMGADDELMLNLIRQIPETERPLANSLTELVLNFRCDRIMSLSEPGGDFRD